MLDIEMSLSEDVVIMSVVGDFDFFSSKYFKQQLVEVCTQYPTKDIKIDMSKIAYMDSSILGILISVHKQKLKKGRKLILANVVDSVKNVLYLASMHDVLNVITDN